MPAVAGARRRRGSKGSVSTTKEAGRALERPDVSGRSGGSGECGGSGGNGSSCSENSAEMKKEAAASAATAAAALRTALLHQPLPPPLPCCLLQPRTSRCARRTRGAYRPAAAAPTSALKQLAPDPPPNFYPPSPCPHSSLLIHSFVFLPQPLSSSIAYHLLSSPLLLCLVHRPPSPSSSIVYLHIRPLSPLHRLFLPPSPRSSSTPLYLFSPPPPLSSSTAFLLLHIPSFPPSPLSSYPNSLPLSSFSILCAVAVVAATNDVVVDVANVVIAFPVAVLVVAIAVAIALVLVAVTVILVDFSVDNVVVAVTIAIFTVVVGDVAEADALSLSQITQLILSLSLWKPTLLSSSLSP